MLTIRNGIWRIEAVKRIWLDTTDDNKEKYIWAYPYTDVNGDQYCKVKRLFTGSLDNPPDAMEHRYEPLLCSYLITDGDNWHTVEIPYKQLGAMIDEIYKQIEIRNNN
jgi:hypothetical protein